MSRLNLFTSKKILRISILLAIMLIVFSGYLYAAKIIKISTEYFAKKYGLQNFHYHLRFIGLHSFQLDDLGFSYKLPNRTKLVFKAKRLKTEYSWNSIKQYTVNTINTANLTINVKLPKHLTSDSNTKITFPHLPIKNLAVKHLIINISRPGFPAYHLAVNGKFLLHSNKQKAFLRYQGNVNYQTYIMPILFLVKESYIHRHGQMTVTLKSPDFMSQPLNLINFLKQTKIINANDLPLSAVITNGTISSITKINWSQQKRLGNAFNFSGLSLIGNESLSLNKLNGQINKLNFMNMNGSLKINLFQPWKSSQPQNLTIQEIDAGVPLTKVNIIFQLHNFNNASGVLVKNVFAHFAKGTLSGRDISINFANKTQQFTLILRQIDIATILKWLDQQDWQGSGTISGKIPIIISGKGISIIKGQLHTLKGGIIRYIPKSAPNALSGNGATSKMLLQLLSNFHYKVLKATISHNTNHETDLKVTLEGNNPDFYGGHPVKFNISIGGPLITLMRNLRYGQGLSDYLQERLNKDQT